jgi:molybdenum cofactor sulfurtransferase
LSAYLSTPLDVHPDYAAFVQLYPEYQLTWLIDTMRHMEFKRLDRTNEAYDDYMGGCLYPESLVSQHAAFLSTNILGNTHSVSNR